jgi:hypothetical protein
VFLLGDHLKIIGMLRTRFGDANTGVAPNKPPAQAVARTQLIRKGGIKGGF